MSLIGYAQAGLPEPSISSEAGTNSNTGPLFGMQTIPIKRLSGLSADDN